MAKVSATGGRVKADTFLSVSSTTLTRVTTEREMVLDRPTGQVQVRVRRSARRRRTVGARREGGTIIVMIPDRFSRSEEQAWVVRMVDQLESKVRRGPRSDDELMQRAGELAAKYLDGPLGRDIRPRSIRWVTNQNQRWGSCSSTGDIRLSHRLQVMPTYVIDSVIVHELAHLVESNHNERFQALVARYPHLAKAEGFLEGWDRRGHLGE